MDWVVSQQDDQTVGVVVLRQLSGKCFAPRSVENLGRAGWRLFRHRHQDQRRGQRGQLRRDHQELTGKQQTFLPGSIL